jgi:hypothetical protein
VVKLGAGGALASALGLGCGGRKSEVQKFFEGRWETENG